MNVWYLLLEEVLPADEDNKIVLNGIELKTSLTGGPAK